MLQLRPGTAKWKTNKQTNKQTSKCLIHRGRRSQIASGALPLGAPAEPREGTGYNRGGKCSEREEEQPLSTSAHSTVWLCCPESCRWLIWASKASLLVSISLSWLGSQKHLGSKAQTAWSIILPWAHAQASSQVTLMIPSRAGKQQDERDDRWT